MTEADTTERRGMSRREMIRAAGIAGAAAWTAPMVIDSLSSPAAAQSQGCAFACSATYVFYLFNGTVYYSGYTNEAGTACNNCKTENQTGGIAAGIDDVPPLSPCLTCAAGVFWGGNVQGGTCTTSEPLYFILSSAVCPASPPSGMTQAVPDPNCSTHLILSGDGHSISPGTGVTFLGAFAFNAGSWFGRCPNGEGNLAFAECGDPC